MPPRLASGNGVQAGPVREASLGVRRGVKARGAGIETRRAGLATVIVADEYPIFREALAEDVREDPRMELVAEPTTGAETLRVCGELRPAVLVVDAHLPDGGGIRFLTALRQRSQDTGILLITREIAGRSVERAIKAGVQGVMSRRAERGEICESVARVAAGELLVDPRLEHDLLVTIQRDEKAPEEPRLSEREIEILRLAAEGSSTEAIAANILLSPETIKSHLRSLFEKLEVPNRTAAVAAALRRGYIE